MNFISGIWNGFKAKPDIWFFYGFLLSFTLSVRKVLFFYPIQGQFNEYSGSYLYLSDIFLALTLFFWAYSILQNKYDILSRYKNFLCNPAIYLPLSLVLWSFISILWSHNPEIALFRSIKIGEFFLAYLYLGFRIVPRLPRGAKLFHVEQFSFLRGRTLIGNFLIVVVFIGLIQAIIGIWQFIVQHSVGLFWLKESLISPDIPGVAKIIFHGEKFIRAYGLFPHPNILGGFLIFSIFCSFLLFRIVPRLPQRMFHVEQFSFLWGGTLVANYLKIIIIIQLIALILSFSKAAVIGFIFGLMYLIVSRGTFISLWNKMNFGSAKRSLLKILPFFLVLILALIIVKPNYHSIFEQSLQERSFYLNVSRGTIVNNWFGGIGMGQLVTSLEKVKNIEIWQFQPVHNVFILITVELGIVGLVLFLVFLLYLWIKNVPSQQNCSTWNNLRDKSGTLCEANAEQLRLIVFRSILIAFLFIMFFDHYLWDVQQGNFLLWITLGFILGNRNKVEENKNNILT